jgi:lactoylglutathione lyase
MFTGQIRKNLAKLLFAAATIVSAKRPALAADANTPDIKGLAHICIYTKDIQKSLKFYTETLGFELIHQTELTSGFKFVLVKRGSCIIELLEPIDITKAKHRTIGAIDHIALEVADINKAFEQLKAKGITFYLPVTEDPNLFGGVKIAFFGGPAGETFELFEYLKPVPGLHDNLAAKN